jgi:hypothetical protein
MATMRQIQSHEAVMRTHDSLVHLEVGWATAQTLNVDTPLLRVQTEGLQRPLLAKQLDLINVLVSTVVAGTRVTLRVFVRHGRAQSIEDGPGGHVLRGDEENGLLLTLDLLLL